MNRPQNHRSRPGGFYVKGNSANMRWGSTCPMLRRREVSRQSGRVYEQWFELTVNGQFAMNGLEATGRAVPCVGAFMDRMFSIGITGR